MDEISCPERTWLCSILFLDIVDYSSHCHQLQLEWKARLNHFVLETLEGLPEQERFILDTGDGAIVCFMGGPEAVVDPALRIRKHFVETEPKLPSPMIVRMGINLGPVQLVKDINGHLNALGDGINVGQRVMSFAAGNQILVSHSFYEVVSRLSDSYQGMFSFVGARKDKHNREHLVYQLAPTCSGETPTDKSAPAGLYSSAISPAPFDAAALDHIEALFVPFIGPIAGRVIKDISQKHSNLLPLRRAVIGSRELRAKDLLHGFRKLISFRNLSPFAVTTFQPAARAIRPSVTSSSRASFEEMFPSQVALMHCLSTSSFAIMVLVG